MAALSAPLRAALMMTLCSALIAASTFGAKFLGKGIAGEAMHPFQISFGRHYFALIALTCAALFLPVGRPNAPLGLYVVRALCGWLGVTGLFAAAALIPLTDATAITFLNPVFAMFLAILFLGERVGPVRWGAAAAALIGGALLIRPGAGTMEIGALIALFAAIVTSIEITLIKRLTRTEGVLVLLLLTNTISATMSAGAAVFVWTSPNLVELGLMAWVGLTMVAAQFLFTLSIRAADASFVAPFFYGTLIFATVYDAAWFGEYPGVLSIIGAGLILAGAVVLAWREARAG